MADEGKLHSKNNYPGKIFPALLHNPQRTDGAKVLYAHMHWRYGKNHQNFEGLESMGKSLDVSETTIGQRIRELEADDWLVVEERGVSKKTGNYSTNFYHVFEDQQECRAFRQTYAPPVGNTIRSKPKLSDVTTRKSRKGKGGLSKPDVRHQTNSDSAGQPNSNWAGGANSDSSGAANSDSAGQPNSNWPNPLPSYQRQPIPESDSSLVMPPAAPQPQAPAARYDDDRSNILPIEKPFKSVEKKPINPNTRNGHSQQSSAPKPPSIPGGSPLSDNPPLTRIFNRWTHIRTGVPTKEKLAEQKAEIEADLAQYGEKILMDAMGKAEEKLPELDGIWSWNFVRSFYPSKAELAKLKARINPANYVDNDPTAPMFYEPENEDLTA